MKPDLEIFDEPRFAEWRPGQGKGGTYITQIIAWLFGWA
jgi:hypothetical protein